MLANPFSTATGADLANGAKVVARTAGAAAVVSQVRTDSEPRKGLNLGVMGRWPPEVLKGLKLGRA